MDATAEDVQRGQAAAKSADPGAKKHRHLGALDGVRGLAVLLVLLDHASDANMRLFAGADLDRAGKYGVYLFFVLSAFLLTWLPLAGPREELVKAATWLNYLLRRVLRIFPIYAVVLFFYYWQGKLTLREMGDHLLFRAGEWHFWSVPVEFKFYFFLPLLVLAIFGIIGKKWWLAGACAVGAAFVCTAIFALEKSWSLDNAVHLSGNLPPFLLGAGAAVVHLRLSACGGLGAWTSRILETVAILALAISILRVPAIYSAAFFLAAPVRKLANDPQTCGVLWSLFLLGTLHGRGYLRAAMEWAPLRYLGLISFSAYLWHRRFLGITDDLPVPTQLRLLAFVAVVAAVASVSYWLIERPLSRIRLKTS